LGLVDELGNLEDTIAAAAQMAGIRGEPEVLYPEKKRFSLFDLLIQETMQKIMENLKESAPPLNFLYYWPFRG